MSDFIVGFPGETDADFEATMQLIEDIRFDQAFSFIYSPRPGTPAAGLPDDLPREVKQQRLARLQARILEFGAEYNQSLVGTRQTVLVERPAKKGTQMAGRTSGNRWVNFDGHPRLVGHFVEVQITDAQPNSLRGRVVDVSLDQNQSAA
jgi:tRNA-2-methylthio-N6-dimethylallyladenosine synthase